MALIPSGGGSVTARPVKDRKHKDKPQRPRPLPPPVTITRKGENLDRRIRNLESLGDGVFIGNVLASYMALPGLVGFWPMSSVQRSTGNAYDLSGQSRTLTYNGNPAYTYFNGLVPYIDLDGTGDFLSRADETDLDILGTEAIYTTGAAGLTMGCWAWMDTAAGVSGAGVMSKLATVGQYSYALLQNASGNNTILAYVSTDGTNLVSVTGANPGLGVWFFTVVRFIPSTSLDIWVNSTKTTNTSSIPASIFNGTSAFEIGRMAGVLLDGRVALAFLCANALGDDLVSSLYQSSRILFGV